MDWKNMDDKELRKALATIAAAVARIAEMLAADLKDGPYKHETQAKINALLQDAASLSAILEALRQGQ